MAKTEELVWTEVDSSNIAKIAYHDASKTLCVRFHNGGLYSYHDVDMDIYVGFVHAESVGKFLNTVVKPVYGYNKHNDEADLLKGLNG